MGKYKMEEERVNEYPLYYKAGFDKKADRKEDHYIYRTKRGRWMVTSSRAGVRKGTGVIETQRTSQLPTSEGVAWKFYDDSGWVPDDTISAIDGVSI